jgi:hypothetical protein
VVEVAAVSGLRITCTCLVDMLRDEARSELATTLEGPDMTYLPDDAIETCDECEGEGVYLEDVDDDMIGERCDQCHGTGWVAS